MILLFNLLLDICPYLRKDIKIDKLYWNDESIMLL